MVGDKDQEEENFQVHKLNYSGNSPRSVKNENMNTKYVISDEI